MSKQALGKTLLRNVIRHTDAHNKIQEEMEMWKMRDWEIQTSDHKHLPKTDIMRGSMHCDRVPDQSRNMSTGRERMSEHDDREARYWTRKLYEFEAGDPDRWGHSGFKELYPEEFDSDRDRSVTIRKTGHRRMKKSKSDTDACLSKRSKKSSRKKKKKKKKKAEDGKSKKDGSLSNDSGRDDRSDTKDKQRKKKRTKSRHKNKKSVKTRRRDEDSSTGESDGEGKKERQTNSRKKRKRDSLKDSDSELDSKKKRRKDWKAACEESSDDSSTN